MRKSIKIGILLFLASITISNAQNSLRVGDPRNTWYTRQGNISYFLSTVSEMILNNLILRNIA